jgi:hypothetical protein
LSGFGLLFLGFSTLLAIHGVTGSESVAPDKLLAPHNTTAAVTHEISRMDNPRPIANGPAFTVEHIERAWLESNPDFLPRFGQAASRGTSTVSLAINLRPSMVGGLCPDQATNDLTRIRRRTLKAVQC